jgi:predicted ATPase/class 3 adenylate cyclase
MTPVLPTSGAGSTEVRKTVTVVFSDLADSTLLGAQLDTETLRRVMSRYFESMRVVLERHGGTLEKYIGDAIMAVFGVPVLHEDDALRAVRAAAEMRDALAALNDEVDREYGFRLSARIGVNTGEVVAGDPSHGHLIVTGRAVNIAKRLEEAAETSEILIGESTRLLVRNAALLEPVDDRAAKGSAPLPAWRLVGVLSEAPAVPRRLTAPLVGRRFELTLLRQAFDRSASDGTGHFVTLLGSAGVGKSRLVTELLAQLEDSATVLKGRCLPYGEGITYWPLTQIVRAAAGLGAQSPAEEAVAAIAARLGGERNAGLIAERMAGALGVAGPGVGKTDETSWAVRKLFEALARPRPLVVVLEDLHWAEPTFLDLVEDVSDSRDAPVLMLCIARPELLDERPTWGGGKLNATTILLDPLNEVECRELIGNLLAGEPVAAEAAIRIAEAAEGNPLFTEELVALLVDEELLTREGDRWTTASHLAQLPVPPSIQTLLSARIERLPDDERALVTRASVEGSVFHRSAATTLAPGLAEAAVEPALTALVRKDVIRPERSSFAGDDAYRFRHVLIRDAAYNLLSKETRAELHERFADWLEDAAGGRPAALEEIVGYHLEQAYRARRDLVSADAAGHPLAARAALGLESGGRRALARGDLPAATSLLERARWLAVEAEDEQAEARVLVEQQFLQLLHAEEGGTEEAARTVERFIPLFDRLDDQQGLCSARRLEAWLHWNEARAAAAAEAWERAAAHARRAGDEHARAEILTWIASSLWFGPVPVAEGIRRCEEIRREVSGDAESEALTLRHLGGLHAMEGRFDVARELLATSNAVFADFGLTLNAATSHTEAVVELQAGEPAAAEASLRRGYDALVEMGERAFLSTTAAFLGRALLEQERDAEAEDLAETSALLADRGDLLTQVLWRGVRARILAKRGAVEEAEALAREAVTLAERTDFVNHQADALVDLAYILNEAGRAKEARAAVKQALRLYQRKGNLVAARKIRSDLAVLLQT